MDKSINLKNDSNIGDSSGIFNREYLPYIIKWGKITTWASILFIFFPPLTLAIVYGARVTLGNVLTGLAPLVSIMAVWYFVDPIALFPILGVPGLYITYIAGNSKEIRGPAAIMSMEAAGVNQGTPEGTIISCFGIAVSVYVSVFALSLGVLAGSAILKNAPPQLMSALSFLLPSLFGGLLGQRVVSSPKAALISIPIALVARFTFLRGIFNAFPGGGGYMPILICVFGTMLIVKSIEEKRLENN